MEEQHPEAGAARGRAARPSCALLLELLLAVGLIVAREEPAAAQARRSADARARALFQQAEVHFHAGEFEQARKLYTSAYKLRALPGFLFNIAQCHRFARQHERALFFYRAYLSRLPDARNRAEVERLITSTEAELARESRERAMPGPRMPPRASPSSPSPAPAGERDQARDERRPAGSRAWLLTGAGASAALLVAGAVTGGLSIARSREYREAPSLERRDAGLALATTSVVTLATGAAIGVATLVYWRVAHVPRARAASPAGSAVAIVPLPAGGAALVLGGAFR
jgi:tetratricopeptide (TPR) repeat protein